MFVYELSGCGFESRCSHYIAPVSTERGFTLKHVYDTISILNLISIILIITFGILKSSGLFKTTICLAETNVLQNTLFGN